MLSHKNSFLLSNLIWEKVKLQDMTSSYMHYWNSIFHLAKLFTFLFKIGYIPTVSKPATLCMLIKPDQLPSLPTSYQLISLISAIMKLFERVIETTLRKDFEGAFLDVKKSLTFFSIMDLSIRFFSFGYLLR